MVSVVWTRRPCSFSSKTPFRSHCRQSRIPWHAPIHVATRSGTRQEFRWATLDGGAAESLGGFRYWFEINKFDFHTA